MSKRIFAAALAVLMSLSCFAPGANAMSMYLIPDSQYRELTEAELWEWQYDALGFILNEIFARHGFPFDPDGRFHTWFHLQDWYREDPGFTYESLSNLEWRNEQLVKIVRQQMRDLGTRNLEGKPMPEMEPDLLNIPDVFSEYMFQSGQNLAVYAGPGPHFVRGANGKASVSTNGTVYVAGTENGWTQVLYRTNAGNARMGYVENAKVKGGVFAAPIHYLYQSARVTRSVAITDDPVGAHAPLGTLAANADVILLGMMFNNNMWAFIEAQTAAGLVRGCVPADAVQVK